MTWASGSGVVAVAGKDATAATGLVHAVLNAVTGFPKKVA